MNIAIILIILLVGSIFTYFSGNKLASKVAIFFSVVAAVFSIAMLLNYGISGHDYNLTWVNNPHITFSLKVDGLSMLMTLLTTIGLPIILLTSIGKDYKNEKSLYSLVLFMAFAMVGSFLSSDALLYYIFWELSLIPIYFIIVVWGNGSFEKRKKSAAKFFIYTFAGSLFMLVAIIYMYTKVGSFRLEDFYNAHLTHTEQIWIFIAFFLAYAIKLPIFPFHTWQAKAYQKAPAIGTMLLGAIMSKMAVYSIIRWQLPLTPDASYILRPVVLILCIIGVIYGCIIALKQDNIKSFLAYVSLSHVGIIAAGIYSLTIDGIHGAILLIVAHAFSTIGLFYAADIIYSRTHKYSISTLGGIRPLAGKFAAGFFLCILASIALPLSLNFSGEFSVMYGLFNVNIWYTIFIGLSMFLGAFILLKLYQQTMLGEPLKTPFRDLISRELFIFVVLVIILFFFGIYSKPLGHLVVPSIEKTVMCINR